MKVGDLPWVRIPPGPSVARPEAIRATQGPDSEYQNSLTRETRQQFTGFGTVWLVVPKPTCRRVSDLRREPKVFGKTFRWLLIHAEEVTEVDNFTDVLRTSAIGFVSQVGSTNGA